MKFVVEKSADPKCFSNIEVYRVRSVGQAEWFAIDIWHDTEDGSVRCTRCSGRLVAMRSSCKHANAARRYIKKQQDNEKGNADGHPAS